MTVALLLSPFSYPQHNIRGGFLGVLFCLFVILVCLLYIWGFGCLFLFGFFVCFFTFLFFFWLCFLFVLVYVLGWIFFARLQYRISM